MKKLLLTTTIVLLAFCTIQAQTKQQKIHQLIEATNQRKMMDNILNSVFARLEKPIDTFAIPTKKQEELTKLQATIKDATKDLMNDIYNQMENIYDKYYTEADIDLQLAFYKSDIGQKMLTQMPTMVQEMMVIGADKALLDSTKSLDAAKKAKIDRLIDLVFSKAMQQQLATQIKSVGKTVMTEMVNNFAKNDTSLTPAKKAAINATFDSTLASNADAETMEKKLIEIKKIQEYLYDKYYTSNDIDKWLAYQSSPTAKKMQETMPKIMTELQPTLMKFMNTVMAKMKPLMNGIKSSD